MKSDKFEIVDKYKLSDELLARARKVKLLLMDCDGVLTDGRLYFTDSGETMKVFHVRDGQGLSTWHNAGFKSGIITGRNAEKIINSRADELKIHYVECNSVDKTLAFEKIVSDAGVARDEVAYIGDDIGDICLLKLVGLPIAVADAHEDVIPYAFFKTSKLGGHGAVREITDLLLHTKDTYNRI